MEELLSLKWKNHGFTFLEVLRLIRTEQMYSDVTLACEGKFYSAHKMVLTACSDYFRELFFFVESKNPVIILKDIESRHLESLLDYMYMGEVNVKPFDISSIMKVAECLKIKGLNASQDEANGSENPISINATMKDKLEKSYTGSSSIFHFGKINETASIHEMRTHKEADYQKDKVKEEIMEHIHTEPFNIQERTSFEQNEIQKRSNNLFHFESERFERERKYSKQDETADKNNYLVELKQVLTGMKGEGSGDNCTSYSWKESPIGKNFPKNEEYNENFHINDESDQTSTNKQISNDSNIKFSIPNNNGFRDFPHNYNEFLQTGAKKRKCPYCIKSFPFQSLLRNHIRLHTGEKPFACNFCTYNSNQKGNLKTHLMTIHNFDSN